jgi:adenosylhomocysteine nucleosidase
MKERNVILILICANAEWQAISNIYKLSIKHNSPFGEYFLVKNDNKDLIFLQTGCGKVNAAAATQYAYDKWNPDLVINLGTCGGFEGDAKVGDLLLIRETVIYDIIEELGNVDDTLESYRTIIDLSWIDPKLTSDCIRSIMISADKDIVPAEVHELKRKYSAIGADWESAAIAFVTKRNRVKCLILRGVSDIVGESIQEIYDNNKLFKERTNVIMKKLINNSLISNIIKDS